MKNILLVASAIVMVSNVAFADFYIVRSDPAGPCTVVEGRPESSKDAKTVLVGDKPYPSREAAQKEIQFVCKSE
jgi:hypothetical protein